MDKEEFAGREELRYDIRLVERYLREGKVGRKDFESYIKKLPDDAARSEEIKVSLESEDGPTPHMEGLTFTSG